VTGYPPDFFRAVEDRLRAVKSVAEAPGRTVAAFNEAAAGLAARGRELVEEFLRVNWPTIKRMELAERRSVRRAESRPVLSKQAESSIQERREQLSKDAEIVRCPPSVLMRAWLLEDETTRASAAPRPGRRGAPIPLRNR
jgi:hypothetical protein